MMLATSTAVTVLVINVHYRGVFGNQVPPIIRTVILNWLARLMGLKQRVDMNVTPKAVVKQVCKCKALLFLTVSIICNDIIDLDFL